MLCKLCNQREEYLYGICWNCGRIDNATKDLRDFKNSLSKATQIFIDASNIAGELKKEIEKFLEEDKKLKEKYDKNNSVQ